MRRFEFRGYSMAKSKFVSLRLSNFRNKVAVFHEVNTNHILQSLSSRQAKLENFEQVWLPTEQSYWDTEDRSNNRFLGYTFGVITRLDY